MKNQQEYLSEVDINHNHNKSSSCYKMVNEKRNSLLVTLTQQNRNKNTSFVPNIITKKKLLRRYFRRENEQIKLYILSIYLYATCNLKIKDRLQSYTEKGCKESFNDNVNSEILEGSFLKEN
ncbi:unnamed protein product [Paramecium primaurelia]|uniref:Uncharacterized protein n=1 Tax=Paramecium primaurelia TaxID=5886 RepID=A0A8S1QR44_PARPR|nr:unnamed protein product [Paramecium primaurelia]